MNRSSAARNLPSRPVAPPPRVAPRVPAVLYARVSSKDQEKEGFSIPAQQKLLRTYAEEKGFVIREEFTDIETAKKAGRTSFGKMLAWLRKNTTCRVILVEKTDRLYRNLRDWVELDGMALEIHLVKEAIVLSESSRSHEKFIHGIKVLMAKNYIDNLSEEVKKGMLEKAEQGIWPGPAPLGYRNVEAPNGKRIIELDPVYAPAMKRMFELYATGTYTLKALAAEFGKQGIKSRKGATIQVANIHLFLHNPLYKGEYLWNGKWYQGSHPAIVTPETWERVQDIMAGRGTAGSKPKKQLFAFNGLVHCGVCAELGDRRLLVGEMQRGKYIYYHCNACQRAERKPKFIREEVLSDLFTRHLRTLRLDGLVLTFVKDALRESAVDEQRYHHEAIDKLTKRYAALQKKLDVLYDDRLEGRLTLARYDEKADALREEMVHARAELERHESADRNYTNEGIALLELAGMALELWESQDAPERRRLLDFLCLNTEFRDGELTVRWKKPFDGLAESIEKANGPESAFAESEPENYRWLPIGGARQTSGRRGRPVFWCGVPFATSRIKKKKEGRKLGKRKGVGKLRPTAEQTRERLTALLDGVTIKTRADLARHLGVSRAYVTQVLGPVVHAVHAGREDEPRGGDGVTGEGGA